MSKTASMEAKQTRSLTKLISIVLLYIYFLLFLLSSVVLPFFKVYNSYSTIVEFILIILIFILNINHVLKDKKLFIIFLVTVLLAALSLIITNGGVGSFLNIAKFLMGLLFFSVYQFTNKGRRRLFYVCLVVWAYYLFLSTQIWGLYRSGTYLINPNTVGIILFSTSVIVGYYISENRKRRWLPAIIIYALTFIGIMQTQCRSTLLALVIFLLLNYVPFLKPIILKIKNAVMSSMAVISVIFARIYANRSFDGESLTTIMSYNEKGLYSGRDKMWSKMFDQLNADKINYITGLGTKYGASESELFNNFHNWYFGMLYSYGIPVCILYFYLFIKSVDKIKNYAFLCAMISIMAIGFFETMGQGGVQICIFMYFVFGGKRK